MITPLAQGEILCGKLLRMPKLIPNLQSHCIRTTKCMQMPQNSIICTLARIQTDFQCEGINIKSEDMVKMLGNHIDKKLKFTSHVTEVIRKCAYQLNALKRKSKILNTKTKMLMYIPCFY